MLKLPRLTLFGRSLLLIVVEVLANAGCWTAAAVLFATKEETRSILGLSLLAWTLGLRHALDADHISAIDNATRGLLGMGQLPVTCGLFFSLGHSTIVIVVNVAIAISTDIADKLDNVGEVGGIIGASISGSFLFLVAVTNSIILWRVLKRRQALKQRAAEAEGMEHFNDAYDPKQDHMLMMRLIGPIITFVNKPWKMYPVGVLFGFGFDTASSIALLAISALAKKDSHGNAIPSRYILILPFLFTAGMTLVDSLDSIMMLYSYAGFPERSFKIFEMSEKKRSDADLATLMPESQLGSPVAPVTSAGSTARCNRPRDSEREDEREDQTKRDRRVKMNMMSGLSIILTLMSILAAFSISLITIMGLIGENCRRCREAAEAEDGGGLAGRWWRGWAHANDNSGYIGAGIVGAFVVVVAAWYGGRWIVRRHSRGISVPQ
ncbi:NicO-domain-containing protein [Marasmius fiardii PR-910]|nr:NicO-domain-containing protein [Marasmius fiardii PR-910]